MSSEKVIEQLRAALHAEIESYGRSHSKSDSVVDLKKGRRTDRTASGFVYEFPTGSLPPSIQVDRGVEIKGGDNTWHTVERCAVAGGHLTLTAPIDLGADEVSTQLRQDGAWSCRQLLKVLTNVKETKETVDFDAAARRLFGGRTKIGDEHRPEESVSDWPRLNTAQGRAVARALGSEASFVWGPPGTGKTDVVAAIVEAHVRRGRRVLFTAPTNVAVDQAMERICERLADHDDFEKGLVQRLGDIQVDSLRERFGDVLDPAKVVSRLDAPLRERQQALQQARSEAQDALDRWHSADEAVAQVQAAEAQLATFQERRASSESRRSELERRLAAVRRLLQTVDDRRLVIGRGRKRDALEAAQRELLAEMARDDRATEGPRQHHAALADTAQRCRDAAEAAIDAAGPHDSTAWTEELDHLSSELREAQASLDQSHRQVERSCLVLATTTVKASYLRLPIGRPAVVIIDEAGMVDTPTAFLLSGLARHQIVFAGDFRQLPTISKGQDDSKAASGKRTLVREWYARDPFTAAGLVTEDGRAHLTDRRLVELDTQYRMHPEICDAVNVLAYPDAPLRTGRDATSCLPATPLLKRAVALIDTSDHATFSGTATRNRVHAALVRELVRMLQHDGLLPARRAATSPDAHVAVIAPYNDQVRALDRLLKERFGQPDGASGSSGPVRLADTVHRFQGSQRPLVIVDTVAGGASGLGPFYRDTGLQSTACRLLNVAISRAQDQVVVVANLAHFRAKLQAASEVRVLLDHLDRSAHRIDPTQLIPVRTAAELSDLGDDESSRPAFFPADETDAGILWDMGRATERIEIYCAFLKVQRVRRYASALHAAVGRGVTCRVYARDSSQTPDNARPIDELRALGCTVETRDQMHEKVVILDSTTWMGSLNLFQHTRSTELMMRVEDRQTCEEIRRTVANARPTKPSTRPTGEHVRYLEVPYAEKDDAKARGARWDPAQKKWYIDLRAVNEAEFANWR